MPTASKQKSSKRPRAKENSSREGEFLKVARSVLAKGGPGALTLRHVAEAADSTLTTLQYYFPTKSDLIQALSRDIREHYRSLFESAEKVSQQNPEQALIDTIKGMNSGNSTEWHDVWGVEVQFWAMAFVDPVVSEAVDAIYTAYRQFVASLVHRINPHLTKEETALRAAAIVVMIDGSMLLTGPGRPKHRDLECFDESLLTNALLIAKRPKTDIQ